MSTPFASLAFVSLVGSLPGQLGHSVCCPAKPHRTGWRDTPTPVQHLPPVPPDVSCFDKWHSTRSGTQRPGTGRWVGNAPAEEMVAELCSVFVMAKIGLAHEPKRNGVFRALAGDAVGAGRHQGDDGCRSQSRPSVPTGRSPSPVSIGNDPQRAAWAPETSRVA
jgi:hypothetical protein